jgi:hypothetical protein
MIVKCDSIYGVKLDEDITPIMVRDAIIECFYRAHGEEIEKFKDQLRSRSTKEFDKFKRESILNIIKSKFDETGGDFDHPTKEILIKVVIELKNFTRLFRDQEIIEKHANEIMTLINKLA